MSYYTTRSLKLTDFLVIYREDLDLRIPREVFLWLAAFKMILLPAGPMIDLRAYDEALDCGVAEGILIMDDCRLNSLFLL